MNREPRAEATPQAHIHLVDDDVTLRTALSRLLRAAGYPVRTYASAAELLMQREGRLRGCLLLDVRMPGGPSGMDLHQALLRQGERLPVVFLTGHGDIPMSVQAVKNGAFDFLTKPVTGEILLATVAKALEAEEHLWQEQSRNREVRQRFESLSPTEKVVFSKVVAGAPNKQIASEIGCSERTVKAHRAQVMRKMEASSLPDLVCMAADLA